MTPDRGSDKYTAVADALRESIVRGEFAPGSRLPMREELEQQYSVSKVTMQRAMSLLIEEGFIDATRRKGSFVSNHPPHLTRYALIFPGAPTWPGDWMRFWTALSNEALAVQQEQRGSKSFQLSLYYGVDGHDDSEDYQRLLREIRSHRVAGLIFASPPYFLVPTPLMTEPNLPRIAIMPEAKFGAMPFVALDEKSFVERAAGRLAACGKRRVAMLYPGGVSPWHRASALAAIAAHGMETRDYWTQSAALTVAETARNAVHLLLHRGQTEVPDALIIFDDNLVEHATAGLLDAGLRVPQDIEVVAHCNFPWPTRSLVPVHRLGYDARHILELCIASISGQRAGEAVSGESFVPALFEEELPAGAAARVRGAELVAV